MKILSNQLHKLSEYVAITIMDLIIIMIFSICCHIFPFGKYTSLIWDADSQYLTFMAFIQNFFQGKSYEALYSLNIGMGNGTIGLLSYYLMSPYNLIVFLFSKEQLPIAIGVIQILKLVSISYTMLFYLKDKLDNRYLRIAFALAYAFSGYSIAMLQNFMFLDAVILLPLIAYFIEQIEHSYIKLFVAVWLLIVTNFYIGYSTCFFIVLFYIYTRIIKHISALDTVVDIKRELLIFGRFIITLLASAGSTGFILLPVIYELSKNRLQDISQNNITSKDVLFFALALLFLLIGGYVFRLYNKALFTSSRKIRISFIAGSLIVFGGAIWKACGYLENLGIFKRRNIALPLKFFIGSYNISELIHGLPNIYITVFAVVIILVFSKEINNKVRLVNASFIIFVYLLMSFRISNYIWSGFTEVSGSPYRYSFCIIFVLIKIAAEYSGISAYKIYMPDIKTCLMGLCILAVSVHIYRQNGLDFLTKYNVIITAAVAIIYFTMLKLPIFDRLKYIICLAIVCVEVSINAVLSLNVFVNADYDTYLKYCEISQKENDILKTMSLDRSVYRTENNILHKSGWSYVSQGNSIVHYSSVMPSNTVRFLKNYGMAPSDDMRNLATSFRSDADPRVLSFLGIRYILSSEELTESLDLLDSDEKDYYLYHNNRSTSMILFSTIDSSKTGILDESKIIAFTDNENIKCAGSELFQNSIDQYNAIVNNNDTTLISTIIMVPYENGLHVYIDGTEVPKYKAFGFYLGFDLMPGEHEIVINYQQPYLMLGIIISIISTIIYLSGSGLVLVSNRKIVHYE